MKVEPVEIHKPIEEGVIGEVKPILVEEGKGHYLIILGRWPMLQCGRGTPLHHLGIL
jgi:hypothetical protein